LVGVVENEVETQLYYLRSRYYNPEWYRFVNADVLLGEVGGLFTHNIFAYCYNNPIVHEDSDGKFGKNIELPSSMGWIYRIDEPEAGLNVFKHIHVVNEKKIEEYIQNQLREDQAGEQLTMITR
jgi:RHS repeat-associated core domain